MATQQPNETNALNETQDDVLKNTSTTEVGHQGANDEDPTGAVAAGGDVNSDIDTTLGDEGTTPTAMGAHRESGSAQTNG